MHIHHKQILEEIKKNSGKPTHHTFLDSYLGNTNPRYPINNPTLRKIASAWMKDHKDISAREFMQLLDSLIHGESSTEKLMAGFLLDIAREPQRKFSPKVFHEWLDQLTGWVEVDTICTSKYTGKEIPLNPEIWIKLLTQFAKSKNINKRRASLVFLCRVVGHYQDQAFAEVAFNNINLLKHEKEVLITKAISWLLRSMIKYYRPEVTAFIKENRETLPAIAVRETTTKLKTGTKTKRK